jgi:hypothetical protein
MGVLRTLCSPHSGEGLRGVVGFLGRIGASLFWNGGTQVKSSALLHCPVSTAQRIPSKKTVRMGDKAKPLSVGGAGGFAV